MSPRSPGASGRVFLAALLLVPGEAPLAATTLARGGRAVLPIVLAREHVPAEATAADELRRYLDRATSGRFRVVVEDDAGAMGPAIFVGPTAAARRLAIEPAALGAEQWRIRTAGPSLVLAGGRPRGTLYAVYRFLEDHVGVRWWTPFEEAVPRRRTLELAAIDEGGRPAFAYRDVTTIDGPREFCARNRLNGHYTYLTREHGGREEYGPPQPAHTFSAYVPPEEHFAAHPEYFSELDGERTAERSQLCLTNDGLLDLVEGRLRSFIAQARAAAERTGEPAPRLYSFSPNDWNRACTCPSCKAIAEREGGQAGPLVQFLNRLAARIEPAYPDVRIDTLAYLKTFDPPRGTKLRDNVVVRLSALQDRDFSRPVTDAAHHDYQQAIAGWGRVTPHLRIWDYSVAFGKAGDLPLPNLRFLPDDYRYYLEHGVEGMFVQHEYPISADFRDLKLWVMARLLEDPYRDYEALLEDFTDGYYGAAGESIRSYLALLEAAAEAAPAKIGYPSRVSDYRYLDGGFLRRAHALFDRAEREVSGDPDLKRRVRHARLSLDRATLARWEEVGPSAGLPDPRKIVRRYERTWREQIALRGRRSEEPLADVDRRIARMRGRAPMKLMSASHVPPRFRLLVVALLVQAASLRSLDKYVFHGSLATLLGAAALGGISVVLARSERLRSWRLARSPATLAALIVALAAVSLYVHPLADDLKLAGRGSDHDDAMIQGAQNLFSHFDPYREKTYLGNGLSPGPGWILVAAPLSLTGLYGLFFPLSLGVLLVLLRRAGAPPASLLSAMIVLLAGLGIWEALATGGDLLPLGVALVGCLTPLRNRWKSGRSFALHVLFVSLVLTGRFMLPILIPLIGFHLYREGRRRDAARFVAATAFASGLIHGLFYWRAASYMPFDLLGKGVGLLRAAASLGPWLIAVSLLVAVAAAALALAFGFRRRPSHQDLVLSAALCLTLPLAVVALGDLAARQFALTEWEGSNYLLVTLPLWIYYYGLHGADPAVERPS